MIKNLLALPFAVLSTLAAAEGPGLTIYNQDFAVVRDSVTLDLQQGVNDVRFSDLSAHVEPDSIMLRDPAGKVTLRILEQNYWNDPISQGLLLQQYEGRDLQFETVKPDGSKEIVTAKLIRSGYMPHAQGLRRYGQQYYQTQMMMHNPGAGTGQPIIELDGKILFSFPGTPIFDALSDDTVLKPTANWKLAASESGALNAELSYVTGGMGWEATYNLVAPSDGNTLELGAWITMDNQSGKEYADAAIQLMAGDVQKIQPGAVGGYGARAMSSLGYMADGMDQAGVSERSFDEFHLYTLPKRTTLQDRETKQVEFVRATGIESTQFYVYKGVDLRQQYRPYYGSGIDDPSYGAQSNTKVWIMREFTNSTENSLGIALPKGLMRFYRRDGETLQFIGESTIDHTPKDETVRAYLGNAFDLVGVRRQTDFKKDYPENQQYKNRITEKFEIKLRNHKTEAVQIRVEEDLYRWTNWVITESSVAHTKTDHDTIEFRVDVPVDGETILTYTVEYLW